MSDDEKKDAPLCDTDIINFRQGHPSNTLLSKGVKLVQKASMALVEEDLPKHYHMFGYGNNCGEPHVRRTFAEFLSRHYKDDVSKENVMVSAGASMGIQFILRGLLPQYSTVFVGDAYYWLGVDIVRTELKYPIVTVPTKSGGLDLDYLESRLKEELHKKPSTKETIFSCCLFIVPTYNNPKGTSFSEEQCESIVRLAEKYRVLVLCDDVYNILTYSGSMPKRLRAYESRESPGHIVSNGSFSKLLMPSLRLGWIEAAPHLINILGESCTLYSGGCCNQYMSLVVAKAIDMGLVDQHVLDLNAVFRERVALTQKLLHELLSEEIKFEEVQGGYFLWLQLPTHVDMKMVKEEALHDSRIIFHTGSIFCSAGEHDHCIRVCIARVNDLAEMETGVRGLCRAINSSLKKSST